MAKAALTVKIRKGENELLNNFSKEIGESKNQLCYVGVIKPLVEQIDNNEIDKGKLAEKVKNVKELSAEESTMILLRMSEEERSKLNVFCAEVAGCHCRQAILYEFYLKPFIELIREHGETVWII